MSGCTPVLLFPAGNDRRALRLCARALALAAETGHDGHAHEMAELSPTVITAIAPARR